MVHPDSEQVIDVDPVQQPLYLAAGWVLAGGDPVPLVEDEV